MNDPKPTVWECTHCNTREDSPIAEECPECGVTGKRYPKDTNAPTYRRSVSKLKELRRKREARNGT